ncbi:hypothetical protein B5K11_04395 [Rhizobium leguminosarum bv. trifolii]|nr:hypothetical protein B5K11_04395 [Rhizobium leguminosarum bv. trifolii]
MRLNLARQPDCPQVPDQGGARGPGPADGGGQCHPRELRSGFENRAVFLSSRCASLKQFQEKCLAVFRPELRKGQVNFRKSAKRFSKNCLKNKA